MKRAVPLALATVMMVGVAPALALSNRSSVSGWAQRACIIPGHWPFRARPFGANITNFAGGAQIRSDNAMPNQLWFALLLAKALPARCRQPRHWCSREFSFRGRVRTAILAAPYLHVGPSSVHMTLSPACGEIDVLDPAGYGTLTITKAISIQGHGFAALARPVATALPSMRLRRLRFTSTAC